MPVDNIIAYLEGRPEHVVNPDGPAARPAAGLAFDERHLELSPLRNAA